jgi:AcrR family transcriptional regulator
MNERNPKSESSAPSTRERVLVAAERLLSEGAAEFSMRDLAAAAGVSFATPFNQFGSKLAIMHALSARLIAQMHERASAARLSADASKRVLEVVTIAASVMMENPQVNRAIMGAIGSPGGEPGDIRERSRALWADALGDAGGLVSATRDLGLAALPEQLAIAFRGTLSFWSAGEIPDEDLQPRTIAAAASLLFGFVEDAKRDQMAALMRAASRKHDDESQES